MRTFILLITTLTYLCAKGQDSIFGTYKETKDSLSTTLVLNSDSTFYFQYYPKLGDACGINIFFKTCGVYEVYADTIILYDQHNPIKTGCKLPRN